MLATSRAEAFARGDIHYNTGTPCRYGHNGRRFASSGACADCSAKRVRDRHSTNRGSGYRFLDIAGKQFERWRVLDQRRRCKVSRAGYSGTQWLCRCECGTERWISVSSLRSGSSHGCRKCSDKRNGLATAIRHGFSEGAPRLSPSQWGRLLRGAASRGRVVSITREQTLDLFILQEGKCALSQMPITLPSRTRGSGTASLDRIDNDCGYIPGNVQWTHWLVNKAKGTMPQDQFISLCRNVADNPTPKRPERETDPL